MVSNKLSSSIKTISLLSKNNIFLLLFIWFILTSININKAFHIDDTFHLEAAQCIQQHPLHPMSGHINWLNDPKPMHAENQPPLFFFLIAGISFLFGYSEIALHLFLSLFTFLALFYFNKTTKHLNLKHANILLLLFGFCPAFILNQNLMVDVPILSFIMAMAYYLLKAKNEQKFKNYLIASCFLTLGLLIKYSTLPLLVLLLMILFFRKDYKYMIFALIPIGALCLWSFWNFTEYGGIHLFGRKSHVVTLKYFWAFIGCIGSVVPFTIAFLAGLLPFRAVKIAIASFLLLIITSIGLFIANLIPHSLFAAIINVIFIVNGFVLYLSLFFLFIFKIEWKNLSSQLNSNQVLIFLFVSSTGLFILLFSPTIATRHILLILPFILILGHQLIDKAGKKLVRISVISTILLGIILGISDWMYADYYRTAAKGINLPNNKTTWTIGHWGWQWYSKQAGMKMYSTNCSNVSVGDYIIIPRNISAQKLNKSICIDTLEKKWQQPNPFTFFSVSEFASFYSSEYDKAPWCFSQKPIDTVFVCRITSINDSLCHHNNDAWEN